MPWTYFYDMASGGYQKTDFSYVLIEGGEDRAKDIFEERFGQNPEDTACECCGQNFSIDTYPTLEQATAYERGCRFDQTTKSFVEQKREDGRTYQTLEEFKKRTDVLIIPAI